MKKLSVIIPTFNREALLAQALDSLAKIVIDFSIMEVIVIDDGSTDRTAAMLRDRADPFELRVFKHEQAQGPGRARNRGAREARGEILAFLDSDILIDANWWQAAAPHFDDPAVAAVEGATIPIELGSRPTPFTHIVANTQGGQFLTCNMLYRRALFLKLGGFDQRFMRANREDSDLAFSFIERGHRLVFESKCIVRHPIVATSNTVYFKEAAYGYHEALLRRKHPGLYHRYLKWIDGQAFPVFYWGIYFGLPLSILLLWAGLFWPGMLSLMLFGAGWSGSVYAVCRKRQVTINHLLILFPQFLLIPWIRLYWVLAGEWRYKDVKPRENAPCQSK